MKATRAQWSQGAAGPVLAAAEQRRRPARKHWRDDAACAGADPDLFFPDSEADAAEAKAICAICPARSDCLADALASGRAVGVWGGEYFVAGKITRDLRRRVNRLRPAPPWAAKHPPGTVSLWCDNGHRRSTANTREGAGGQARCMDCERDRLQRSRARAKAEGRIYVRPSRRLSRNEAA